MSKRTYSSTAIASTSTSHSASLSSTGPTTQRRPTDRRGTCPGDLSSWILCTTPSLKNPKPPLPFPILSSPPLTDRRSTFIAHAAPATSLPHIDVFHSHIRHLVSKAHPRPADHEMVGYRVMALRNGRNGLGGEEDWFVKSGGEDDGEKGGSRTIVGVLEKRGEIDVVVVVSRWYGGEWFPRCHSTQKRVVAHHRDRSATGIMLGPDRFRHISTVTTQALVALTSATALTQLLTQLHTLDDEISTLTQSSSSPLKPMRPDYSSLDLVKAQRLVMAREKRLELLRRKKEEEEREMQKELEEFIRDQGGEQRSMDEDEVLVLEVQEDDLPPLPDLPLDLTQDQDVDEGGESDEVLRENEE
ncbi:BQ2448_323 [Microbotryum intermedium]|uniref:BQ2448_323 protein n=1 Tax=Microbotryum intermedium TaxID=269621 RepID=A0A238F248_9BASI|nr:BQ2448_323 [Microbotryum intermedium]